MEFVDVCAGTAINIELRTRGAQAQDWLVDFAGAGDELPSGKDEGKGVVLFVEPRELAAPADPILRITLFADRERAEVSCRWEDREVVLSNRRPVVIPKDRHSGEALVRHATAAETLELAMRWFLAWGRMGCVDLREAVFFADRMAVAALACDDVELWTAGSVAEPAVWNASAVVYAGADVKFGEAERVVEAAEQMGIEVGYFGMYATEKEPVRLLVGATVEGGASEQETAR